MALYDPPTSHSYFQVKDAPADLSNALPGQLVLTTNPLGLWAFGDAGWQLVGAPSGEAIPPPPASESGQGVVELATEAEVQAGTAGILVATAARLKAELDRRVPTASESAAGIVELASAAEVLAGTAGALVVTAERLKPEAWIAPTLLNSWVANTSGDAPPGYRKTATGEVQLRGSVMSGTMTNGTVLFNLPAGYRPAHGRRFTAAFASPVGVGTLLVATTGDVSIFGVTGNAVLSLEAVRFDV